MRLLSILLLTTFVSCTSIEKKITNNSESFVGNNFRITIVDTDITNPEKDRRCFYWIYIDKQKAGRTTVGLESQNKVFESNLEPNNHLVRIEKWILEDEQKRYVKLNNIEQPKPDFIYVTVEKNKASYILVKSGRYGKSIFLKN